MLILLFAIDADKKRKHEEYIELKKIEKKLKNFCEVVDKNLKLDDIINMFDQIKKKRDINFFLKYIDDKNLKLEILKNIFKIFYADKKYDIKENKFVQNVSTFWNLN